MSALPGGQWLEPRVVFAGAFAEAHRAPLGQTACLVDLGSEIGSADEIVTSTRRLLTSRPWLSLVLLTPHMNPDLEAVVIFGLRDLASLRLLTARDLSDPAAWMRLLDDHFVAQHALKIEADLRNACPDSRAWMFEDAAVSELLRGVARVRHVGDLAAASGSERVAIWRRFKRRWGHSPSEMLSLFRVLWASHLRREGYANCEIARLLGFRDVHHCARRLGSRLGLRKSMLNHLAYAEVVDGVVRCLTRGEPAKQLVRRATAVLKRTGRVVVLVVAAVTSGMTGGVGALRDMGLMAFLDSDVAVAFAAELSPGARAGGRRRRDGLSPSLARKWVLSAAR
jgi:hypothetical protein